MNGKNENEFKSRTDLDWNQEIVLYMSVYEIKTPRIQMSNPTMSQRECISSIGRETKRAGGGVLEHELDERSVQ